jgi:hypothetical protein
LVSTGLSSPDESYSNGLSGRSGATLDALLTRRFDLAETSSLIREFRAVITAK